MGRNEARPNDQTVSFLGMRSHTLLIQIFLLVSLLLSIYLAARRGVGAWYFRQGSPDAIQAAVQWDPSNPQYYDALGTLMHLYASGADPEDSENLYRRAVYQSPHEAQYWSDLGASYDWAGRPRDAFDAFQRAQQLFPNSPEINWRFANFCIRTGKTSGGLQALKTVLSSDNNLRRDVFVLAANARLDKIAVLDMLPPRAPVFFDYLNFRISRDDISGAEEVWSRILKLNLSFDLHEAMPYVDALIQHKQLLELTEAWSALLQRFPAQLEGLYSGGNLIANGNFAFDTLNGGLDWRVLPTEGAAVSWDSTDGLENMHALRITFDGSRNLDYGHVFQYVLVQPNTRYRFSIRVRAEGITTDSGPHFQVSDAYDVRETLASTEKLLGTSDWSEQRLQFTTKPDTHLLLVRVVRPWSTKLDSRLAGTVRIGLVSLTAEP